MFMSLKGIPENNRLVLHVLINIVLFPLFFIEINLYVHILVDGGGDFVDSV